MSSSTKPKKSLVLNAFVEMCKSINYLHKLPLSGYLVMKFTY